MNGCDVAVSVTVTGFIFFCICALPKALARPHFNIGYVFFHLHRINPLSLMSAPRRKSNVQKTVLKSQAECWDQLTHFSPQVPERLSFPKFAQCPWSTIMTDKGRISVHHEFEVHPFKNMSYSTVANCRQLISL